MGSASKATKEYFRQDTMIGRVFVSTVIRKSKSKDLSGFVFSVDWKNHKIIKRVPITDASLQKDFWNPRGGNRGARGICIYNDMVYVASATAIFVLDLDLRVQKIINNEYFAGIHSIVVDSSGLYVLSTIYDLVVHTDFDGALISYWNARGCEPLLEGTGVPESRKVQDIQIENISSKNYKQLINKEIFHMSGLAKQEDFLYVLSGSTSSLVRLKNMSFDKVLFCGIRRDVRSPHDLCIVDDKIVINNTRKQQIHVYSNEGQTLARINTLVYGNQSSLQFSKPGWQRGLFHIGGMKFLVGTSPLTVFLVDLQQQEILDKFKIVNNVRHCTYDICATKE
jgi:hypothetical protein